MPTEILWLPVPRRVEMRAGNYPLPSAAWIVLCGAPQELLPAGRRFQVALEKHCGLHWKLTASPCVPPAEIGLSLRIANDMNRPQGYRLEISPAGITIEAADPAGAFYGVCTCIQWLE